MICGWSGDVFLWTGSVINLVQQLPRVEIFPHGQSWSLKFQNRNLLEHTSTGLTDCPLFYYFVFAGCCQSISFFYLNQSVALKNGPCATADRRRAKLTNLTPYKWPCLSLWDNDDASEQLEPNTAISGNQWAQVWKKNMFIYHRSLLLQCQECDDCRGDIQNNLHK